MNLKFQNCRVFLCLFVIFNCTLAAAEKESAALPRNMPWPVAFQDDSHNLGFLLMQFQESNIDYSYYHSGTDLRVKDGEMVYATATGKLEAGHYSYVNKPDGSAIKKLKPWPQKGDDKYFELAIITNEGYRFEYHHIRRDSLPQAIVNALNKGNAMVSAGDLLGKAYTWNLPGVDGQIYNHIHYNIVDPQGVSLNPEYYSLPVADHVAPEIKDIFAIGTDGAVMRWKDGDKFTRPIAEFVVGAVDMADKNVYVHTPALAQLIFKSGQKTVWDFRERLATMDGAFPPIFDVFAEKITSPEGTVIKTRGSYKSNYFLMRLKVPAGAKGPFEIQLGDQAGNISRLKGSL